MLSLSGVAEVLKGLLGADAEAVAEDAGLIRRERKFTASTLISTVVLGSLQNGEASSEYLARMASDLGVDVTAKAVRKRFTPQLVGTLRSLLQKALNKVITAPPVPTEILNKFTAVSVGDSTTVTLPDEMAEEFPGCGGSSESGKAAMKLQVELNQTDGTMTVDIETGRDADAKSPMMRRALKAGELMVRDLGYFSLERFQEVIEAKAYFLSRLQPKTKVFDEKGDEIDLPAELRAHTWGKPYERMVFLGVEERVPCRLVVLRVPQEIAARRRQAANTKAKKDGRMATDEHLSSMDYTMYVTNCGADLLTWKEVVVLYRSRWQIELLFKLWKSDNRLAQDDPKHSLEQRKARLYGKLIGVVIQHWVLVASAWTNARHSLRKGGQLIRRGVEQIAHALTDLGQLTAVLDRIARKIDRHAKIERRKKHPSLFQLYEDPELLDYTT